MWDNPATDAVSRSLHAPAARELMSAREEVLEANARYAEHFGLRTLPGPPVRRLAILTCMDSRLDPAGFLGLEPGDAHVIRNAGAVVTDDVIRGLVMSTWLMDIREVLVIAHTRCRLLGGSNEGIRKEVADRGGVDASTIDFHPFADLDENVRTGLRRIAESPLLPGSLALGGFVYDVESGTLRTVPHEPDEAEQPDSRAAVRAVRDQAMLDQAELRV
jgi:carbonic anhydrase